MNQEEFAEYQTLTREDAVLHVAIVGYHSGTLAYGYTVDHDRWHAYVEDQKLHVVIYEQRGALGGGVQALDYFVGEALPYDGLRPGRYVYPDTTDPDAKCKGPMEPLE